MVQEEVKKNRRTSAMVLLFLVSYAVLYALTFFSKFLSEIPVLNALIPTAPWDTATFFMLPVVGFFGIYYLIEWGGNFFKTTFFAKVFFPITFLFSSLLSVFISILFLFMPASIATGRKIILCAFDCTTLQQSYIVSGQAGSIIFFEFWPMFVQSSFIYFMYAGLLGWVSYKIIKKLESQNKI
jgi:hypothetical protein